MRPSCPASFLHVFEEFGGGLKETGAENVDVLERLASERRGGVLMMHLLVSNDSGHMATPRAAGRL